MLNRTLTIQQTQWDMILLNEVSWYDPVSLSEARPPGFRQVRTLKEKLTHSLIVSPTLQVEEISYAYFMLHLPFPPVLSRPVSSAFLACVT